MEKNTFYVLFLPYKRGNRIYALLYSLLAYAFLTGVFDDIKNGIEIWNSYSAAFFLLFLILTVICWMKPESNNYSFRRDLLDIKNFWRSLFFMKPLQENEKTTDLYK